MNSQRPKPQCVKGFRDEFGHDVISRREMLTTIATLFELHGFDALETPAIETLDALGKFLPDTDRPHEGVFAWRDDENYLALRYDMTAPLSRVAAQYRNDLPSPYRRYAIGPVWRNEKPKVGRFRQFYQCDADTVGSSLMAADAEMCLLTLKILSSVGMTKEDFVIRVNNRKVVESVLEKAGINRDDEGQYLTVMRAIDKLDRLGLGGVQQLLGKGRKDASGDYTEGAGLSESQIDVVMGFMSAKGRDAATTVKNLEDIVGTSPLGQVGVNELREIMEFVEASDQKSGACEIDPLIVRGLGYYTGPVFEAQLCAPVHDAKGREVELGSVAGGGRYDGLVRRFTGQDVPATGLSIGVDRLLTAMTMRQEAAKFVGPVIVTVMDKFRMADYQAMASELRDAGIRAEVYLGNAKNFGRQMKYADKRQARVAVIEGSQEKEAGIVQLKDLQMGKSIAATASHEDWKSQPSQVTVLRHDMVKEVQRILSGT